VPPHDGAARLEISGVLDSAGAAAVWDQARAALDRFPSAPVVVDVSRVERCNSAGVALLLDLLRQARPPFAAVQVHGMSGTCATLLGEFDPVQLGPRAAVPVPAPPLPEAVGRRAAALGERLYDALAFVGEACAGLAAALAHPRSLRWKDVLLLCQRMGADAFPIVSLIAFLTGVILAFQSAVALRQFGAEVFVADLVGSSLLRELGPLMTAILLAGRSGAAFAAEIGTMRVNEEVDALTTMGLDPVRFLVVPRLLAALTMTPLLTLYANLVGLLGGAAVMTTFEIPMRAYLRETFAFVDLSDFLGGMAKSFVFGLIIAAAGCLRGLRAGHGGAAVGLAATSAVVTALVLIIVADGIFAVVYYILDL
jgi:phospholipid/cholesterol/gamma-HCH transport system permease protein